MNYNRNLGVIYDTIRFFDIYFNYDEVKQEITTNQIDLEESLKYYNNVIKYNKKISPQIQAFFAFNGNIKSFLMDLFIDNISTIYSINDLLKLLDNEELIINRIVECYFDKSININENTLNNNDIYINQLYDLELDSNLKISIILALNNYNSIRVKLIDSILIIYAYIEKLTINNRLISEFKIEEKYLNKIGEIFKINTFNDFTYCISLLRNYSIEYIGIDKDNFILVLGNKYKEALERQHKFINVTYESITYILSNKLNVKLIDIIHEYKKINAADMIRILPPEHSSATVYRLLNNLLKEKIIYISERDNKHVYYSLNSDYFNNARIVLDKFLLYYIN